MSWWGGTPSSGYSSGPLRSAELDYEDAEALFARARKPDLGKPLPGKDVRLWKQPSGSFEVTYRDTPVVEIHPDGTYTLFHGGYPTKMTAQRMNEYATADVSTHGKRHSATTNEGYSFYMYDNLELAWKSAPRDSVRRGHLMMQFYPEHFAKAYVHIMPFPRDKIRVDASGRPVLSELLSEIAPETWGHRGVRAKLQPWAQSLPGHLDASTPITPRKLGLGPEDWESAATELPVLVRRSWLNAPAALIWRVRPPGGPEHYRWAAKDRSYRSSSSIRLGHLRSGTDRDLNLAMADATTALEELGWASGAPLLADLLGPLSSQLGAVPSPEQLLLPLPTNERLLGLPAKRVHWMEPWGTIQIQDVPGQSYQERMEGRVYLPRRPLPGSLPWPGETGKKIDVRLWFEVNGHAVGLSNYKEKDRVLVHRLSTGEETAWDIDGVVATGLVAGVLAWLGGLF